MFLLGPGINGLERFFFSNAWSFLYRVTKTQLFHCSKWKCKKHYPYEETVAANIFITKSISRLWAWSTPHSRAILCVSQEHNLFFSTARTLQMIQLFSQHTLFLLNNACWKQRIQSLCTITLTLLQLLSALPPQQPDIPFQQLFSLYPLILHISAF